MTSLIIYTISGTIWLIILAAINIKEKYIKNKNKK